ncbi:MAG: DUF4065 domain-containing protein [Aestuariivita sp.]|nr:DUF4065 domain-containing protein [Aestuariivita sp.]
MANPVSVFSAARRLGGRSGWTLTHLQMQKLLYMSHMYYLGENNEPLVNGRFEAWDYGPVCPDLYHHLKIYGSDRVPQAALSFAPSVSDDHPGAVYLDAAVEDLPRHRLVAMTHWSHGAWSKKYKSGVMGVLLSSDDIMEEYKKRMEWPDEQ